MHEPREIPQASVPFALRYHEAAYIEDEHVLGEPNQDWTWSPSGSLKPEELKIYASAGNSTTQRTGSNQYDHGEFQ